MLQADEDRLSLSTLYLTASCCRSGCHAMIVPLRLFIFLVALSSFNVVLFFSETPRHVFTPPSRNSTLRIIRTMRSSNGTVPTGNAAHGKAREYEFLHVQRHTCMNPSLDGILIVIMVTSAPKHFVHRNTIRTTWALAAKKEDSTARLVFLLGRPNTTALQYKINNESAIFKDIVQQDFIDSYLNLSLKTISGLKWMSVYCPHAKFMLKTDDDMIINVKNLEKLLIDSRPKRYIMGSVFTDAEPVRNSWSKYYTSYEVYHNKTYPPYISGTAYVVSADIIPELYDVAMAMPLFHLEDVFITGMCSAKIKDVQLVNHGGFGFFKTKLRNKCSYYNAISFHEVTPELMLRVWKGLKRMKCFR